MKSLFRAAGLMPFAAFCLLAGSSTCLAQQDTGATFQAPGATLYYEVLGPRKGTPLVVVNGGPGAPHDYMLHTTAWRRLAKHRPVVFYDQRGTGRSGPLKPEQSCTLADQVNDLDALRAHLGAERMDLLGHSWGGFLAMAYAARHPERVAHLVLMGSAAPKFEDPPPFLVRDFFPEVAARMQARMDAKAAGKQIDEAAQTRDRVSTMFYSPETRDVFLAKLSLSGSRRSRREVQNLLLADAKQFDLEPEIRRFQIPALVLNGRFDVLTTPAAAHRIQQAIPGSRLVIFERSGHNPFIEEPEEFVRVMEQFLGEPPSFDP